MASWQELTVVVHSRDRLSQMAAVLAVDTDLCARFLCEVRYVGNNLADRHLVVRLVQGYWR